MIDRLFQLFKESVDTPENNADHTDESIKLAAAALMMEVARSDTSKQDIELRTIEQTLVEQFGLDQKQIHELMAAAAEQVEAAHDLYQFTQLINDAYDYAEKKALIHAMWLVAFADGHIESIEDHIIRRVAGLIHIAHEDFIQVKLQARDSQAS